jgi:hypothetical protein
MPRPREYANAAARQAASRQRKEEQALQLQEGLYRLQEALWDAGDRGDALALACRSSTHLTMLARLRVAFESRPKSEE